MLEVFVLLLFDYRLFVCLFCVCVCLLFVVFFYCLCCLFLIFVFTPFATIVGLYAIITACMSNLQIHNYVCHCTE